VWTTTPLVPSAEAVASGEACVREWRSALVGRGYQADCAGCGSERAWDYHGAKASGLAALLLRRPGLDGDGELKESGEDLSGVEVVPDLLDVVQWVLRRNAS